MKMSENELKEYLRLYGDTDAGKAVREQVDIVVKNPTVKDKKQRELVIPGKKLTTNTVIFKLLAVSAGVLMLVINPFVSVLIFAVVTCVPNKINRKG